MARPKTAPVNRKFVSVGRYDFTSKLLGKGNFARVEEAVHKLLKTKVAIKIMDTSQIKEEYVVRNLEREARIMAQLSHPCITALYETMHCGSVYYLVTEMADGGDMCNYIKQQKTGRLDERTTRNYGRQLISAIGHMHSRGIVHRDLKMENIMLTLNKSQIKIVDFGLSNIWSPNSPLHTHCGSPEYAAPELFLLGRQYGPEVDIWSFGVVLYGMITGRLPFICSKSEAATSQERRHRLLAQINRGLTATHKKDLNHTSSDFKNLIAKLLVPSPTVRLNTQNLLYHPWVTQRQKKMMKINGFGKISTYWQSIITNDIANILNISPHTVDFELRSNRYGDIGAMYNIKEHQLLLKNKSQTELIGNKYIVKDQIKSPTPLINTKTLTNENNDLFSINIKKPTIGVSVDEYRPLSNRSQKRSRELNDIVPGNYGKQLTKLTNIRTSNQCGHFETVQGDYRNIISRRTLLKSAPVKMTEYNTRCQTTTTSKSSLLQQRQLPMPVQQSSIPVPLNKCPLHSKRQIPTYHNNQNMIQNSAGGINDINSRLHIVGSFGLKRPFNQRPATVHPRLKQQSSNPTTPTNYQKLNMSQRHSDPTHNHERSDRRYNTAHMYHFHQNIRNKQVYVSKSTPTSSSIKEQKKQGNVEFQHIGYGDQKLNNDKIDQNTDTLIKTSTNPIARSIVEYVKKNIGQDTKSNGLLRLKRVMDHS